MAVVSNVNRQAVAKALSGEIEQLKRICGVAIQTHRAYEATSRQGQGLTQTAVANQAQTKQPTISALENGSTIPNDATLRAVLAASGFRMAAGSGGSALFELLKVIRDQEAGLKKIKGEKPV